MLCKAVSSDNYTTPIQKIGHLMRMDSEGYLINECNWEAIQLPWLTLVEALGNICIEELGDRLHSLYLRGSVPRGQAILNIHDFCREFRCNFSLNNRDTI